MGRLKETPQRAPRQAVGGKRRVFERVDFVEVVQPAGTNREIGRAAIAPWEFPLSFAAHPRTLRVIAPSWPECANPPLRQAARRVRAPELWLREGRAPDPVRSSAELVFDTANCFIVSLSFST